MGVPSGRLKPVFLRRTRDAATKGRRSGDALLPPTPLSGFRRRGLVDFASALRDLLPLFPLRPLSPLPVSRLLWMCANRSNRGRDRRCVAAAVVVVRIVGGRDFGRWALLCRRRVGCGPLNTLLPNDASEEWEE